MKIAFLIVAIFSLSLCLPTLAFSQEQQDLGSLQSHYRTLLEEYAVKEQQANVALSQYYQLQTLASQEEAVKTMRETMLARSDTLLAYFTLLQASLSQKPGIDLTRKTEVDQQLQTAIDQLKQHRSRVEIATDRLSIDQEAAYMEQQQRFLLAVSERSQAILKIGAMQAALDRLVVTKQKADAYIAQEQVSETVRLEKQRGSQELDRTIASIRTILIQSMTEYDKSRQRSEPQLRLTLTSILSSGYADLERGLSFLRELLG